MATVLLALAALSAAAPATKPATKPATARTRPVAALKTVPKPAATPKPAVTPKPAATPKTPAAPASIPLPRYRVNDAFVFSDGRVERVVKVARDEITWAGLTGSPYVRSRNFVLPVSNWSVGRGLGRRQFFGSAQDLWPVSKPRSVRFRVVAETKAKPASPWQREVSMWTCQSLKPRVVRIALGTFNTIPFTCDRYSATNMRPLERLEWDYAPELGHYVRRSAIQYLRGTRRTVDLVATLSGPAASKRRLQALSRSARRGELPVRLE